MRFGCILSGNEVTSRLCLPTELLCICLFALLISCVPDRPAQVTGPDYSTLVLPDTPNIVWIVAEDLSGFIPSFGDSTVETPNISRLVEEGVKYTRFFSPSGVCAPSRAAIATGMYPTRIGAHHMRTGPWFRFTTTERAIENYPRDAYEAMPPEGVHMLSTYLREAGYYCSNNPKEDYQFRSEMVAWDESSFQAHWKKRAPGQPFYAIFNLDNTHESMIWRKAKDSLLVSPTLEVPVLPYLPDTEVAKNDLRRLYSNIVEMDRRVGDIMSELDSAGLLENTIVFWYTDHGGPLPRMKRTVYDAGIHSPLIVRFPKRQLAGKVDTQLLSFIDLKPTTLSLAGIKPPDYVDGKAWLGEFTDPTPRKYVFSAADRFDNWTDKIRAVRDHRYKLIRYYNLDQPYYLPVRYRETMPIMQELLRLRDAGELTPEQALWFRRTKDSIEFFDTWNDPHELNNIADDPTYADKIDEMRAELDVWIRNTQDKGMMTEEQYVESIWPNGEQPKTADPIAVLTDSMIFLSSSTPMTHIGYQWARTRDSLSRRWTIYKEPIGLTADSLFYRAHRIGYKPSNLMVWPQ